MARVGSIQDIGYIRGRLCAVRDLVEALGCAIDVRFAALHAKTTAKFVSLFSWRMGYIAVESVDRNSRDGDGSDNALGVIEGYDLYEDPGIELVC